MKSWLGKPTKHVLLFWFFLAIIIMTAYASFIFPPYDKAKQPKISLPAAYGNAMVALGAATNQFHCVSASVTTELAPGGEWDFTFYSNGSNAAVKQIVVKFDGEVVFDNGYR